MKPKEQAFSAFFQVDADIDSCVGIVCERIRSEIHDLDLVILVFDVGTDRGTRLNVKQRVSDFVRILTSKKFQIGVVKEMTFDEFERRQRQYGIPTYRF